MNNLSPPPWLSIAPWLFILVWSAGYATATIALHYTEPLTLLALRFGIAFIALTPLVIILRPKLPDKQSGIAIICITFFLQLIHFGCVYTGLQLGASAAIMGLFTASQPIMINFVTSFLQKRLPAPTVWFGLILGFIGAGWILWTKHNINQNAIIGSLLGFFAVIGVSLGVSIENKCKPKCHPILNFWLQYGICSFITVPLALYFTNFSLSTEKTFVLAVAYLAFANSILGIYLLLTIMRHGQVARVSAIMFLVPAISAGFAWLLLDEKLPLLAWPGVILAAIGVLLVLHQPVKNK